MNAAADNAVAQGSRRLSDEQLAELMRLIKGANSVELKLTVPAEAHRATIRGLPMDPVEAQPRQIFFFDTPDLKLFRAGIVVRARRIQGGKGDTVVKLRPIDPDDISPDLKNDPSFNVEVDALPGGFVCSASYKGRTTGQAVREAVGGKKRLSRIFSKGQRAYYKAHAPEGIDMDSLVALGPTFILKGRFDVDTGLDGHSSTMRSMVAEVWLYPDGSRLLELSTKCLPKDALGVAMETRAYLVSKGVPTNAAQETKTRIALEFYSKALAAENADKAAAAAKAPAKPAAKAPAKAPAKATAKAPAKAAAAKPAAKASPRKTAARAVASRAAAARTAAAVKSSAAKTPAKSPAAKTPAKPPAKSTSRPAAKSTARRMTARRSPAKDS